MKLKKQAGWYAAVALAAVGVIAAIAHAANIVYQGNLLQSSGQAYSTTPSLNLNTVGIGALSAQVTYSSANFVASTFVDGQQSTGSFTVVTNTALSTATASNYLTVNSNTGLTGLVLTLPGFTFTNGVDWATQDVASDTAKSIATALRIAGVLTSQATNSAVIYTTAPTYGTYYNSYAMTSSRPIAVSFNTATMTGGQDNAIISINGVKLKQHDSWVAGATAALSATAIAAAINANTVLNKLLTAQALGAVVTATSTFAGANAWALKSSTVAITTNNPAMTGGVAPSFALGGQAITSSNGFTLALPVLYVSGSASIGGLTTGTTYYAYPVSSTSLELVKYATSAVAGVPASDFVTFTSSTTQLSEHTSTLTALPWTGTAGFYWQNSNDGINWTNIATSSVTFSSTTPVGTSQYWSFGYLGAGYIRMNFAAPTTGGALITTPVVGTN